jgi:hypothetical protein
VAGPGGVNLLHGGPLTAGAAPRLVAGNCSTTASVNVRSRPDTGYPLVGKEPAGAQFTLQCQWQGGSDVSLGIDVTAECRTQYGYGAVSAASTPGSAWSWHCHWNITPQMQKAANWAISEKNSPNPTWSDHFGHYWSGRCEQFAEQAEGFQFSHPSALADYQAELNASHIHTGTIPPLERSPLRRGQRSRARRRIHRERPGDRHPWLRR